MARKNRRAAPTPWPAGDYEYAVHAPGGDLVALVCPASTRETRVDVFRAKAELTPADREACAAALNRLLPGLSNDDCYELLWPD